MFTQGEVIVRDDLKYPEGAVVVDGIDARGHLLVHPLGGGLQFAVPPREVGRFQSVEPAEQIPVFSAGTATTLFKTRYAVPGVAARTYASPPMASGS